MLFAALNRIPEDVLTRLFHRLLQPFTKEAAMAKWSVVFLLGF